MTAHKPFAAMKDSGVAWLGKIPAHWDIKPIWVMFQAKKQTGFSNERLLSVYRDYGVIPKDSRDDNKNRESEDLSPYQLVVEGDLVTNKMKTWQGSIAVSDIRGIVSPAYFVYGAKHGENNRYIHYLLRSVPYIAGYQSISKGIRVGQWDLDADKFRLFPVLIPPLAEQNDIVRQLESEVARIDNLIARKTHFIELLAEKRQVLITHVVTKGLNPKAKMKDSGVKWLGQVPEHWEVAALSRITLCKCDGPFGSGLKSDHYVEQGARVIRLQNIRRGYFNGGDEAFIELDYFKNELSRHEVIEGDVLIAGLGDDNNTVGRACVAPKGIEPAIVKADCFRFRVDRESTIPEYIAQTLTVGSDFDAGYLATGATRSRIPLSVMASRKIPLPPLDEQAQILAALAQKTARIDALITKTKRSIELLREHRTSLITAAVTGKIDLRDNA